MDSDESDFDENIPSTSAASQTQRKRSVIWDFYKLKESNNAECNTCKKP